MNPELCSSCPTPWKKFFKDEWEAEERLAIIARHPDNPERYPKSYYWCPFAEPDGRGGMKFHIHLTSIEKEEAY